MANFVLGSADKTSFSCLTCKLNAVEAPSERHQNCTSTHLKDGSGCLSQSLAEILGKSIKIRSFFGSGTYAVTA